MGIEFGKYHRYFPNSGQEEKAIPPPLRFNAFTAPDLLFTDTSAPPGVAIYTPERERGYIALGVGSKASDPEILLAI